VFLSSGKEMKALKKWYMLLVFALTAVAATLVIVAQAVALPSYATQTGKSCGYCHVNPGGGGTLTAAGTAYKNNGHKLPTTTTTRATTTTTARATMTTTQTTPKGTTATTAASGGTQGRRFLDVGSTDPLAVAIDALAARGIINGFEDGTFRPAESVKRMQFAKMIVRTMGLAVSVTDICPFPDVFPGPAGSLYPEHYIAVAASQKITDPYPDGTFRPQESISRAQVVTMVVRAVDGLHPDLLKPASTSSAWGNFDPTHGPAAAKAQANGLFNGLAVASLDPWAPMPRGEVARILYNVLAKLDQLSAQ
jgi:hypothetical protein